MKNVQEYISRARGRANNQHLNFVDSRHNFIGQPSNLSPSQYNATGAPQGASQSVKKSLPYAVRITSTSNANVVNFDVLGATTYLENAGFNASNSLVIGSITIDSAVPGVSYRDLLYQSLTQPFTVGATYLQCSTTAQVTEVVTITTKDSNGTLIQVPVTPFIDPYQNQLSISVIDQEYRIDGFTKLTFSQIWTNAVFTIRFYPSDTLNQARILGNQAPVKQYGDPGLIR